jgi:Family of unknown function (DUF6311)
MTEIFIKAKSHRQTHFLITLFLGVLFGVGWYLLLFGPTRLRFSNVDWIYTKRGDLLQHQLGWEFFRQEPWQFPLGRIEAYGYPFGTYLSYMDSIPLMAIPFKVLSPWLGTRFQYIGLWDLLCIIGQMLVAMLILREFTGSYLIQVLGAFLLILSPAMIVRFTGNHDSLAAHWILLSGIWFTILEYHRRLWRAAWPLLFAMAMLVHLYFAALLLPLWGIGLFFYYSRKKEKWKVVIDILVLASVILLAGYGIGLFSLKLKDLSSNDYGYYSWNLNGFINPSLIRSAFIKPLPVGSPGQKYEGYSYLGLGILVLLPMATFLFLRKEDLRRCLFFFIPYLVIALPLGLFAISQKAYLGFYLLWDITLPKHLITWISTFHSSARFIWPLYYFLVLFGIVGVLRNFRHAIPLLVAAVLVQCVDLRAVFSKDTPPIQYQSPLQSEFWQEAARKNQHVILLPATWDALDFYGPIALYARQNRLTLNWGYFSRADYDALQKYGEVKWEDLKRGKGDPNTLYIFYTPDRMRLAQETLSNRFVTCRVDGYEVILTMDNGLTRTNTNLQNYCTIPTH